MLIPRETPGQAPRPQGCGRVGLAELRRQLTPPSNLSDGSRQRLLELARCLARVRALGDEYGRVTFSDEAAAAVGPACLAEILEGGPEPTVLA